MLLRRYSIPLFLVTTIVISLKVFATNHVESVTAGDQKSAEDESLVSVPFITLRNKTGSKKVDTYFGGERGGVYAGYCDVNSTSLDMLKPLASKSPYYIPDDILKLSAIREVAVDELLQGIKGTMGNGRPVIYVHGFYISFERGCRRASVFQKSAKLNGRFLFFSWPSAGSIIDYTQDESDLYWSVDPLKQKLSRLVEVFGKGNVDIAAHSLGTRGVMLALVMMAQADEKKRPLFNQVVLIAPDIDEGIFRQYLPMIRPLAKSITIYVSDNDQPLALSRQVHGHPRMGESGQHLDDLDGVEIIDVSDISVRYPSGHVYHLFNEVVIEDINQLLNENKRASQRLNLKQTGKNYWRLQQADEASH